MKITAKIELYVPSGFYCMRNGKKKCSRLNVKEHKRPYCEFFYPFLDTDKTQLNVLKCDECLLAEKKARIDNG